MSLPLNLVLCDHLEGWDREGGIARVDISFDAAVRFSHGFVKYHFRKSELGIKIWELLCTGGS